MPTSREHPEVLRFLGTMNRVSWIGCMDDWAVPGVEDFQVRPTAIILNER
jgi:hypothetical protein